MAEVKPLSCGILWKPFPIYIYVLLNLTIMAHLILLLQTPAEESIYAYVSKYLTSALISVMSHVPTTGLGP